MKFIFTVFILSNFALISVDALPADGLKIEANHGEDVTLSFTMDKAEEAEQMKIIFTSETTNETRVIARHCAVSDNCHAEETDGVKLLVGKGLVNVTIQKVNSSRAGLYEVDPVGKDIPAVNPITLFVNDASPNSSNLFGQCALIPLVISVGRLLL